MAPSIDHKSDIKRLEIVNYGAFRWRAISAIKAIVLEAGGFIFGGFVRDLIRHDKAASAYYERLGREHTNEYIAANYDNTLCDAQSLDRLIVPRDMDIMMYNKSTLELLKIKLNNSEDFSISFCTEFDGYMPMPLKNCSHHKLIVTCKISKLLHAYLSREPAFELDIIVLEDNQTSDGLDLLSRLPPFGDSDFECNKLVLCQTHGQEIITMDNRGKVGAIKHNDDIQRIIKDIIAKRAVFTHSCVCEYRIKKMLDKGFSVESQNIMAVLKPSIAHNVCTICHDEIEGLHVKRKCCSAAYHGKCLDNVLELCKTCPQCRATFDGVQNASRDRLLCQGLQLVATDVITFGTGSVAGKDSDRATDTDSDNGSDVSLTTSSIHVQNLDDTMSYGSIILN